MDVETGYSQTDRAVHSTTLVLSTCYERANANSTDIQLNQMSPLLIRKR